MEKQFLSSVWKFIGIIAVILCIILFFLKPQTGSRGALVCLIAGLLLPATSLTVEIFFRKKKDIFILSLAALLLIIWCIGHFYGLRAFNLFISLSLGISLSSLWLIMGEKFIKKTDSLSLSLNKIEASTYLMQGIIMAQVLAGYHFRLKTDAAWTLMIIALVMVLVWILSIVFFRSGRYGMQIMPVQMSFFAIIFLAIAAYITQKTINNLNYFYPILFGVVSGFLLLAIMRDSSFNRGRTDLMAGALGAILLCGLFWISFRMSLGYGISLGGFGLLSVAGIVMHHLSLDEKAKVYLRGLVLMGITAVLIAGWRVFLQKTDLVISGIDLSEGYIMIGLLAGVFLPLFLEGGFMEEKPREGASSAVLYYILVIFISALSLFCFGLFLGVPGTAAGFLGLAVASFLCGIYFLSEG